jgi:hypothetical protein
MQTPQMEDLSTETVVLPHGMARLASAARTTAKWVMYFAISFALMAGFLVLAHV